MKRVVAVVACLASFLVAKECKTMADLINGCVKTEYNYDKKPIKQSEWKNKKEVRVIYKKEYHNNGNLKSDCRGEGENEVCKYYDENGEFEIEYRGGKPYEGIGDVCSGYECVVLGEYKNGLKNGLWFEPYPLPDQVVSYGDYKTSILVEYVNGVMNGKARICRDYSQNRLLKEGGIEEQFNKLDCKSSSESGYYVNGKKNGMWNYSSPRHNVKINGEFKDGKLIKFTYGNKEYEYEYEYIGGRENMDLGDMGHYIDTNGNIKDKQNVRFAKNCAETLLPDKEGNTNPNSKITGCFIGKDKKIRDGLTTISIEMDMGIFLKDIRVLTFEVYFEKGKIIKEKSKCQYDWKEFGDTTKLEEILNSGKKYTAKTYYDILYAACN